jgi:hypothetical protein
MTAKESLILRNAPPLNLATKGGKRQIFQKCRTKENQTVLSKNVLIGQENGGLLSKEKGAKAPFFMI